LLRVSGYWLLATSILHVLVGLVLFTKPLVEIATTVGSIQLLPSL